jgi:hypothetical protein
VGLGTLTCLLPNSAVGTIAVGTIAGRTSSSLQPAVASVPA